MARLYPNLRKSKFPQHHSFAFSVCLTLICISLSACAAASATPRPTPQEMGDGEGQLDIIAWDGFVENGNSDKRFDWVTDFEAKTGCKVNVDFASSSDEMVKQMNQGKYDLVTAPSDASTRLIKSGKVQPINTQLLPSWDTIDPQLKDAPWHTVEGVHYGVPFLWMTSRLMYNSKVFPTPPGSWDVLYKEQKLPDGLSNKGRIQTYEGPISIADAALYLMTTKPELGITNPYELNRQQFGEVIRLLRNQHDLVGKYWPNAASQIASSLDDAAVVSLSWPYQVIALQRLGAPVKSVIPPGGVTGRADTLMLNSDAAHPNCAYMFMEHMLDPRVQGDAAAWTGSNPSVPSACQASDLLGKNGCDQNGYNDFNNVFFWRTPVEDCGDGNLTCVPYSDWVTAYIAVVGGR